MPKWLDIIGLLLAIIGAVNWGLMGVGVDNVIELVLGTGTVTKVIYVLVGVGGLWSLKLLAK